MGEETITNGRYAYVHEHKWPCEAIDIHHVLTRTRFSKFKRFFVYAALSVLIANTSYALLIQEKSGTLHFWSILSSSLLVTLLHLEPVKKESVVVMPGFGVQLETHYVSGKIIRRFVPISKVLKPLLVECVTPVTCYWSLSLIVRGEDKLMLIFKETRPPLKMLIPIWKALCAAIENQGTQQLQTS